MTKKVSWAKKHRHSVRLWSLIITAIGLSITSISSLSSILTHEVYPERLMWSEVSQLPMQKCPPKTVDYSFYVLRNNYSDVVTIDTTVEGRIHINGGVISNISLRPPKIIPLNPRATENRVVFTKIEPSKNYLIKICSKWKKPKLTVVKAISTEETNSTYYEASAGEIAFQKVKKSRVPKLIVIIGIVLSLFGLVGLILLSKNIGAELTNED